MNPLRPLAAARVAAVCLIAALVLVVAGAAVAAPKAKAESKAKTEAKGEESKPKDPLNADTFSGLALRSIGPAAHSGRVSDIAVDPRERGVWYVAVASGGVWKTVNAGTTWTPIFDDQGSYSIGCVALDPRNPLTVWVGTGENNSQRSVGYGDGVYRSIDGGKSWEKVGLEKSEHVGRILVDPRDGKVVYAAAQGPLWGPGGDRGLYKTTDGGKTWTRVLEISENTGVSDIVFDPRDPDKLYASAYQRRRHVWTLIDGGPESAIYKSEDAGRTWRKLTNGLPKGDVGRIGLAVAPAKPDVVYAIIEATGDESGVYRSTDAGANWTKMSGYLTTSPQYYQELVPDPQDPDRVYSMDTFMMVTDDGGKTFRRVGEKHKHVDNHALYIDPNDTDYLLAGCDGGLYESFDRGATWRFTTNLPITQFYRVTLDNALPFYGVYGGTQDNFSVGGPSRTASASGIVNSDWFVTQGGDGFKSQVDPNDPNIVYAEYQYGGLGRYDRRSGETLDIQPQPGPGDPPLRWNWDSPLVLSPHSPTRLYFAANVLFRSDDRGDSWRRVSGDLTRELDRNKLEVMGRVWGVDAVSKNASTSFYGNIVALAESPAREGLLYAGTDDGLVQVSPDGGATWTRHEEFPGVPQTTYVSCLLPSRHAADVVYVAFDNHKRADFKPYVLRSSDRGRTWLSVAGDLPERGTVYALAEDPVNAKLLFAGTEFGLYFSLDGGARWVRLKGGLPVINVRDLAIQERENDLAIATFGRGFYILDDYTALRGLTRADLDRAAILFPVRKAWMYVESTPQGGRDQADLGDAFFCAPNPPFGATFTWYLKDAVKSLKDERRDREKKLVKEGKPVPYPSWDELRAEEREEAPAIVFTVTDAAGQVVRRLSAPATAGFHRVTWDLRWPAANPITGKERERGGDEGREGPTGPMVAPGSYTVTMASRVRGQDATLGEPRRFEAAPLGSATLPASDRQALAAFEEQAAALQRAVLGAVQAADEAKTRLDLLKKALQQTPGADPALLAQAAGIEKDLTELRVALSGDRIVADHNEPTPPAIVDRIQRVVEGMWVSTSAPTKTLRDEYTIAANAFPPALARLRELVETRLAALDRAAEAAGAPWTPGRLPALPPQR